MPFVDFPRECTTCRGSGRTSPASSFAVNEVFLSKECLTCNGKGSIQNLVYVNPYVEEKKIQNPAIVMEGIELTDNEVYKLQEGKVPDDKEINDVVEEIKNIKPSKKSKKAELINADTY